MGKKISIQLCVFICVIVAVVAFMSAWTVTNTEYKEKLNDIYSSRSESLAEKIALIEKYYNTYYIGEFDADKCDSAALKGFISGTGDKYGFYYTAEEYAGLLAEESGEMTGIGVMVKIVETIETGLEITRVIPDSPAKEAGIAAGDFITEINGSGIDKTAYSDAVSLVSGKKGSSVELTILRGEETFNVTVVRDTVISESVIYDFIETDNIGFIRILSFGEATAEQFANALNDLKEKGAESFIFDLRGNGGGMLTSIIGVCNSLLPENTIVTTAVYADGTSKEYKTDEDGAFDYPCVVLTDKGTASAAELFTAVVKELKNATSIGSTTYGKGVMQNVIKFSDGSAIKLTVAFYNPPSGENYDGVGIPADIEVSLEEDYSIDYYNMDLNDSVIARAVEELKNK